VHRTLQLFERRPAYGRLQLDLSINFGAEQYDIKGKIEPERKNDYGTEGAVDPVVIGKMGDVERKARRGREPEDCGD